MKALGLMIVAALRPGDKVTVRRAPLGSFTMSVPSRRPVKVRRVS